MRDLADLSNKELLEAYEQFNAFYDADYSIDYGEFSGGFAEEYYSKSDLFEKEFEKRGMILETAEMPL